MATKNYMINDKWLDLDKQNIVELQSVDGELDSLKVNGSEIVEPSGKITITENGTDIDIAQYALADVNVEGGGGSSDFSLAEVTVTNSTPATEYIGVINPIDEDDLHMLASDIEIAPGTNEFQCVLYKNFGWIDVAQFSEHFTIAVSGDATYDEEYTISVTGNCTITISAGE